MPRPLAALPALAAVLLALLGSAASAQSASGSRFDLAVRYDVLVGDGEPTNDVLGYGISGHWWWNDHWGLGVSFDHFPEFDVERPLELLGIAQDPTLEVLDSKAGSMAIEAWIERRFARPDRRIEWFWGAGGGLATIDVEDALGATPSGEPVRVRIDAGTDLILAALAGLRYRIGDHWSLDATLRAEHHFADWTVEETHSASSASISDYLLLGGSFGVSWRF